jgi:predicted transport protein
LRPIYDRILEVINALGDDISLQPRKSYVAFARRKQFALVKTSTITRVDLGLKFKEPPISLRLEEAPGLGSGSITHKVALASLEEVDQEVVSWLKMAYEGL